MTYSTSPTGFQSNAFVSAISPSVGTPPAPYDER